MNEANKRRRVLNVLGYSSGDIFGGGGFLICNLLIFNYFVIVEGLSVIQASTIIFICKLWDGITDPLMGFLSDRTHTRLGRRRIYFLIGAPLVFLSFAMLWNSFGIEAQGKLMVYHLITYMLFNTAFTIVMVPYNAILSDMTDDYTERTRYSSVRMAFSATSALLCAVVPSLIITALGSAENGPAQKSGYAAMGAVFGLLFAAAWILTFFGTWENPRFVKAKPHIGLQDWKDMFRNKTYRTFLGIYICTHIAIDIVLALFVFFIDIVLMKYQYYVLVMGILLVCQILSIALFGKVAAKKGKSFPLYIALPAWAVICFIFFFFRQDTPLWALCVLAGLIAAGPAAGNLCTLCMLSDQYEVGELMTTKRLEGLYSGFITFVYKCASGIAILIIGFGLQLANFNQSEYNYLKTLGTIDYTQYNSSSVVMAIRSMMVFVPIALIILVLFFTARYKLNDKRFCTVKNAIERFRTCGYEATFSEEERADMVAVTGLPPESLWGRLRDGSAATAKGTLPNNE